jgi:elongation factor G
MSEVLSYAPDLRAITGGRGEYSIELARYEELPGHLAQQVVAQATQEHEEVRA